MGFSYCGGNCCICASGSGGCGATSQNEFVPASTCELIRRLSEYNNNEHKWVIEIEKELSRRNDNTTLARTIVMTESVIVDKLKYNKNQATVFTIASTINELCKFKAIPTIRTVNDNMFVADLYADHFLTERVISFNFHNDTHLSINITISDNRNTIASVDIPKDLSCYCKDHIEYIANCIGRRIY